MWYPSVWWAAWGCWSFDKLGGLSRRCTPRDLEIYILRPDQHGRQVCNIAENLHTTASLAQHFPHSKLYLEGFPKSPVLSSAHPLHFLQDHILALPAPILHRYSFLATMPPVRTSRTRKPPPDGFDDIEDTLLEFSNKMKDAENASHEGKKRAEMLWPIFQISHQREYPVFCTSVSHARAYGSLSEWS